MGPPKISRATSGFKCTAVIEQPEFWLTHHAALASILASSSITGTYSRGQQFGAAERARQQHAQQPALDQRVDDRLRQRALGVDLGRRGGQRRGDLAHPRNVLGAAFGRGRGPDFLHSLG